VAASRRAWRLALFWEHCCGAVPSVWQRVSRRSSREHDLWRSPRRWQRLASPSSQRFFALSLLVLWNPSVSVYASSSSARDVLLLPPGPVSLCLKRRRVATAHQLQPVPSLRLFEPPGSCSAGCAWRKRRPSVWQLKTCRSKEESTLLPSVIREIFILDSQKKNLRPAAVRFGRGGQTIRPAANFVSAANAANHQSMLNDQSN